MTNNKRNTLMFWTLWLLAGSVLIYVLSQIEFILAPMRAIFTSLFAPLLITGFLFYLLNPLVRLLEKTKIKRLYSIVLVMLLLGGVMFLFVFKGIPVLIDQTASLVSGIPGFVAEVEEYAVALFEQPWLSGVDLEATFNSASEWLRNSGNAFMDMAAKGAGEFISKLTGMAFLIITVPVILFYMLYDGWRFPQIVASFTPAAYRDNVIELLKRVNQTISGYISGKGTASFIVGVLIYIGYAFLKLPSALLLAVFAGITNFIPYVGPFIGAAPAVFVAFSISPATALFVALIVIVVQQGDSNIFTPRFVGKSLSIHPLTVMLVLLAAGNMAGIIGMLIGVPLFAILKTIVGYVMEVRRDRLEDRKRNTETADTPFTK